MRSVTCSAAFGRSPSSKPKSARWTYICALIVAATTREVVPQPPAFTSMRKYRTRSSSVLQAFGFIE